MSSESLQKGKSSDVDRNEESRGSLQKVFRKENLQMLIETKKVDLQMLIEMKKVEEVFRK